MTSIVVNDIQADTRYYFEKYKHLHLDQNLAKHLFLAKSGENRFKKTP
jgi:hypothetical protein